MDHLDLPETDAPPFFSLTERLNDRWKETPINWKPIPVGLGALVLLALTIWKQQRLASTQSETDDDLGQSGVKVKGAWQVCCHPHSERSLDRRLHRSTSSARSRYGPSLACTAPSTPTLFPSGSAHPATASTLGSLASISTNAIPPTCESTRACPSSSCAS